MVHSVSKQHENVGYVKRRASCIGGLVPDNLKRRSMPGVESNVVDQASFEKDG
jgi:hypothetical protein